MEENHGHEEYELNKYSSYYFYEDSEPLTEEQLTALRYSSDLIATNTLPTAADKNTGAPKLLNNNLLSSQELGSDASSTGYAYNHADESAPLPTPVNNTLTTSNGATDSAAGYSYNSSDLDSLPKASEVSSNGSGSIKQSSERVTGYSYNTEEENSSSYVDNMQQDSDDKSTQPANTEQASDSYSYVDNSQHEDTSNANTNSVTKTEVRSASGYSYAGDDSKSSESVYIDNANYHQPSIDKKPAKQVDDLKKLSPVSTSTATPTPTPDLKNWTIDYFSLQNKLYHKVTNTKGPIATSGLEPIADIDATQDFIDIAEDFAKIALEVGQQIIEEKFLPKSKQTILPINAGGIAGGVKYIHRGIFFKFALDEHNIYGGSVERASKAAAHELKGIQALIDWEFKGVGLFTIKFPLTAVIDYRGFRLVATTILPLNSKTLVYGSPDGGKTFNTPDPQRPSAVQLEELLQAWGRYLNLKPHEMNYNGVLKRVCITFDLEGHIGTDGHLYCCDFARVLPPVKPDPKMRGSFLYRLFRLEFCRKYFKPLVADGFLKQLVDAKTNNGEIMEATNYLLYQLIPQTAVMFEKIPCHLSIRELMVLIHQRGINFRYTWLVAHLLKRDDFKRLLYTEMVARTLKHMLNDSFRASGATMSDTYHRLIAELFNKAFGPNNAEFWTQTLPNEVAKWFDCPDSTFVAMSRSMVDGNMSPLDVLTEQTDQVMQQIDDLTEKLYSPYIPRYANYYKGKYIPRTKKNPEEKKPRASTKKSTSTRGRGRGRKATPSKKLTESAYHDKDLGEYDDDYDAEKDSEPKQLTESVQSDQPATPTRRSTRTRRTSTIQADTVDLSDVHEYDGAPAGRRSRRGSRTSVPSSPLREYGEVRDPNKVPSNTNTPPASPLRTDSQGTATPTSQQSQQSTPASSLRNSLNQPPSPAQLPNVPPAVIEKHLVDVAALADRLLSMMSITINPNKKAEIELLLSQGGHVTLDAEDVQDYTPKVKHLFLNLFQHGYFLKARANKAVDLETHINLLEQSRDMYLKCLEMCSMNDFALHNYGRVLNELSKLYVNNPEKKHTVEFLAVWMTKLAHHINQDLKQYDGDVYRYFDVYERDGRVKQVANTPWCREECMTRFVLMEDELRHAVYDAELIEEYYKSLFDEFKHPLHGTVEIHVALSACKILFRHSENKLHDELWSNFIKELDVTSINHLNQEEWDTVFDMLRPILFEVKE